MEKLAAIVDDEEDIRELVSVNLKKAGYKTKEYPDGKAFLRSLEKTIPDVVILDLMMPGLDGIEVCRSLRSDERHKELPVIMLTAKVEEADKVLGLEMGADDYMTKPFSPRELTARVKAVLRRRKPQEEETVSSFGDIIIDANRHEVTVKGKTAPLTSTEFKILRILSSKRGWVFSREQILDSLWGNEKTVVDRTIDVHIKHLREKLGSAGKMIINVRGAGYKIEE